MKEKGDYFEQLAESHLIAAGLTLCQRHFRHGHWEIDLIMRDGEGWVFVEVKYRQRQTHGGPLHALSQSQMQRLRKAALAYLQHHQLREQDTACRFDLIAISGDAPHWQIDWLKNAF